MGFYRGFAQSEAEFNIYSLVHIDFDQKKFEKK